MTHEVQQLILEKLSVIESEIREVRQHDIPNIKIDMALVKSEANSFTKLMTAVAGVVAVAVSTAIAFLR
jgi:Ribonuclease G/E